MGAYILRRILLMIPTILGIMCDHLPRRAVRAGRPGRARASRSCQGIDVSATARITGGGERFRRGAEPGPCPARQAITSKYRGAQGLDPEFIESLEKQFGFDKPPLERFVLMLWNYARFDFGESYFRDICVIELIMEKMPVSISLGLWMTLLSYGDLDSARHPQGGARRLALRRLDVRA